MRVDAGVIVVVAVVVVVHLMYRLYNGSGVVPKSGDVVVHGFRFDDAAIVLITHLREDIVAVVEC